MKHRLFALFLFAAFPVAAAPVHSAGIWDDPDFLARFTASYGVRGDQEPAVTRQEQNTLREVATHMPENIQEAVAVLDAALGSGSSAALDFTLGNLRFQLDEFRQAEGHYRDAIRKFPDFLRAHKNLGLALVGMDEHAEALAALSRALTLGSADGDTYGLIGFAHLHLEHWVSAEAACRQALLFQPDNRNWQVGLVQALQAQDRHAETVALLAEMIARWPGRPDMWTYQANTYIAMDQPVKAAANLELVRRMEALGDQGLLLLADIYVNQNLPALVLSAFEEAFQSGVTVAMGRVVRAAERLSQQGHLAEAVQLVTFIDEHPPADLSPQEKGQFRRMQARLAIAHGRSDEALPLLEEALELNPLDGESLLLLAKEVASDDLEHAEVLLDQAARLPETALRALRQHGELLVQAGHYQEALIPLREAEVMRPSPALHLYIERIERLARVSAD
ncbi:MAG: tetratricopeptide repeat protein [Opitutales bacterium]